MKNFEVNFVAASFVEACNRQCENRGIDTGDFGAFTTMSDSAQLVIHWRFTTVMADGNLYTGFLDDVNDANEVVFEHTTDEFGIQLTDDQKAVFLEFEPKFAVIRRIQHVQDEMESLKEKIQF